MKWVFMIHDRDAVCMADLGDAATRTCHTMMTAKQEWQRGWSVAAGASVAYGFGFCNIGFLIGLFVVVLHDRFGWSRGSIGLAANAGFIAALVAPFVGRLTDRIGVRPVLVVSCIVVGLCYLSMTLMTGDIWVYYAIYTVISITGMAMTGITFSRAIATWFDKSRGLALCSVNLGLTTVGIFAPSMLQAIYTDYGWKFVYYTLSGFLFFVSLPAIYFLVRENPEANTVGIATSAVKEDADPQGWRLLLRKPNFWLLCLAAALTIAPVMGLMSQLQPLLMDKGFPAQLAAKLVGVIALAVFLGSMFSGYLTDRIWAPLIGFAFTVGPVFGCLFLLWGPADALTTATAIFFIGLAYGAEMQLICYLVARYFGTRHYATLFGLTVLTSTIATGICQTLYGLCFDYFGSYGPALWGSAILFAIAAPCYLTLGPYPEHRDEDNLVVSPSA